MKESILSKIKDIALKLAESNDTLTSADLANELKDFGIDGDSAKIATLVWEAFCKYGNNKEILNAFLNNLRTKSLVEEQELRSNLNNNDTENALTIVHKQGDVANNAIESVTKIANEEITPVENSGIKNAINKIIGTKEIQAIQHEAEQIFNKHSRLAKAYDNAKGEVKANIASFVELRSDISDIFSRYATMLVDVFGDSIKVSFPELFDFDRIKFLNTEHFVSQFRDSYNALSLNCTDTLATLSDSFQKSLLSSVAAYKGKEQSRGALTVASMNMISHYLSVGQKTLRLKNSLQQFKDEINHNSTLIVSDAGRLSIINDNVNEVLIPQAELFYKYAEKLISKEFTQILDAIYSDESIKSLKASRDALLSQCKELEQELNYELFNINHYTSLIAEYETTLAQMRNNYDTAMRNKPRKPSTFKNIVTLNKATNTYDRDMYEWNEVSMPVIDEYDNLRVELQIAKEDLHHLQDAHKKHTLEYNRLHKEAETIATKIRSILAVNDDLKRAILDHMQVLISLLNVGKNILQSNIDTTLVEPIDIQHYKENILSTDIINRLKEFYSSVIKTTEKANTPASDSLSVKHCIPIVEEYIMLKLKKEEGKASEEFYKSEFERLKALLAPHISATNNRIELLRNTMAQINTASNEEELIKGILQLGGVDQSTLSPTEWEDFLKGNKTINI